MKNQFYIFPLIILLIIGCKESSKRKTEENTPNKSAVKYSKEPTPQSTEKQGDQNKRSKGTEVIKHFIPDGYALFDSTSGKLKNGNEIIVLVLESKISQEEDRVLLILEKKKDQFKQMAINKKGLMLCENCGGIHGDPYSGVHLEENVLTISHYGGSAWRWSEQHVFRYQSDRWELIGATYRSFWTNAPCNENQDVTAGAGQLEDINFSTNKMHIVHTKDDACEPFIDTWRQFEKKEPILLSNFPGRANQWPNGKIKDGDGKNN